jgi:aminoglycoside 6'-N-acetyltransferase I
MTSPKVRQAHPDDAPKIAAMCEMLWPDAPAAEHYAEIEQMLHTGRCGTLPAAIFVSCGSESDDLTGFLQVGLRSHADGCDPERPVGFIEGWFVYEGLRNQSIGRALTVAAEDWARAQGCTDMASDALIDNDLSLLAHQALGYEVVDRCVHFRKPLR